MKFILVEITDNDGVYSFAKERVFDEYKSAVEEVVSRANAFFKERNCEESVEFEEADRFLDLDGYLACLSAEGSVDVRKVFRIVELKTP